MKTASRSIFAIVCLVGLLQCAYNPAQYDQGKDLVPAPDVWSEDFYDVEPTPCISAAGGPSITLIVFNQGHAVANFQNASALIEYFRKHAPTWLNKGIYVYSHSYAIPDTSKERRDMVTSCLQQRYDDQNWRGMESGLVGNLRSECEAHKIPLYVNTSGAVNGQYRILVKPQNPSAQP